MVKVIPSFLSKKQIAGLYNCDVRRINRLLKEKEDIFCYYFSTRRLFTPIEYKPVIQYLYDSYGMIPENPVIVLDLDIEESAKKAILKQEKIHKKGDKVSESYSESSNKPFRKLY